jgi:hypothetical protein
MRLRAWPEAVAENALPVIVPTGVEIAGEVVGRVAVAAEVVAVAVDRVVADVAAMVVVMADRGTSNPGTNFHESGKKPRVKSRLFFFAY